jgi:spore coat protein U-like protein
MAQSATAARTSWHRVTATGMLLGSLAFSPTLGAQTSTANLSVSAQVKVNCTISTAAIAFGDYDPIGANATSALDATGSITIGCTKGSTVTIGLGTGQNALASVRRMTANAEFLTYEMYQDTTRLTVWGSTGTGLLSAGTAPSKAPRVFTVFGRVPTAQDVSPGAFTDVIVATVNF